MKTLLLFLAFSGMSFAATCGRTVVNPKTHQSDCIGPAGAGTGTVTSTVIAGTANQITVTGTCTITTSGTCTLSLPSNLLLPGTLTTGSGTTAGGAMVMGNATGDTAASYVEANSGDAASNAEPAYLKLWSSHATKRKAALFPCTDVDGVLCIASGTPVADASNPILVNGGAMGTPASATLTNATGYLWANLASPPFIKNAQTSTYQVLAGDFTQCKTVTVASGTFTVTLVASGSQPANGQCINILNYGSGVVTVARSGQNINGGTTSLTIPAASATAPTGSYIVSDGTNYFAEIFGAASGGGTPGTPTGSLQKNVASAFAGQANIFGGGSVLTSAQYGNEYANVTLTQGGNLTLPAQTTPYSVTLATAVSCNTFFSGSVISITTAFTGGTGILYGQFYHGSVAIGSQIDLTQTAGTFVPDVPGMGCVGAATNDLKFTFTGNGVNNLSLFTAGAVKTKIIGSASE